ncbi:MAG: Mur ligase family protein [Acetobacter sp.]|nr:Mur ligase family protein [Bacteroides sp.]MCM1342040.1 Mur ligase family protein [Acetobacter sp.]MCM1434232.1 Mur ligase family protein [Clostridiales bacterium]
MDYCEALDFITKKMSLGIQPGLERIDKLLSALGNPQNDLKIIHIAGTNGKGTVAATIAEALKNNGYKAGLFTSPWVIDYREQIQINSDFISENDFSALIDTIKRLDIEATEFEILTAVMYLYFKNKKVDYAVVECGMGGLGDSTNTEDKNISVITSVAVDHTDFLGDTIEKIAQEKAGIIKKNSVCILYPNKAVEHIFEEKCSVLNSKLIKIESKKNFEENNLAVVNEVLKLIGIKEVNCLCYPPARQEKINSVLIDGGHNVDSAMALKPVINNEVALIGMMQDKNVDGYLSLIAPKCKKIIATTPNNSRSMTAERLAQIAQKYCSDIIAVSNPNEALEFAQKQGLTLVCGSFYLARDIRNKLI